MTSEKSFESTQSAETAPSDRADLALFATCPKGIDDLLMVELQGLGAQIVSQSPAGIAFTADLTGIYRICLYSRLANRVLLSLSTINGQATGAAETAEDLYRFAVSIPWEVHVPQGASMAVDFLGTNRAITNTQFGAMRVKDAVADRLRDLRGQRPDVDRSNPDVRINARLAHNQLTLSLDMSGDSLHRRGYRQAQGAAPLKENLAAAILLRAGWPAMARDGGILVDPTCGSGTFLSEAALLADGIAPGLFRERFGFQHWLGHDEPTWLKIRAEAEAQMMHRSDWSSRLFGFDSERRVLAAAAQNLEAAGVKATLALGRIDELKNPVAETTAPGLVICNPPYGERMGETEALKPLYRQLALTCKNQFPGWQLTVLTGNPDLAREMRLRPQKINKFFNGPIACELLSYQLLSADQAKLRVDPAETDELSAGATMVANRLRKNQARLKSWLTQNTVEAYRLYDADLPEYAAAIDVYGGQVHVQEYAPPKTVNPGQARKRFNELLSGTASVLNVPVDQIATKTRQRNRGSQQYENLGREGRDQRFQICEGKARFWVNLHDYLDTGVFLDHRPLRAIIAQQAMGKSFLNLFCYTATATVHAALAGASQTISVDLSRTYLDWAQDNFDLNRIHSDRHQLIRDDCRQWLQNCRQGFDFIMLDPPTFSNSKKMEGVLDIQRDHVNLIKRCMELLNPGGCLYFSNNLRSFKLDPGLAELFDVDDISAKTLDPDFVRNPKIHRCFRIQHAP